MSNKETDGEDGLFRPSHPSGRFDACVSLRDCKTRVVEENAAGIGDLHAACAASQKLRADLGFKIPHLPTKGRLRRMQPLLGRELHAAFFGDSHEVAQMPQLHGRPYPSQA